MRDRKQHQKPREKDKASGGFTVLCFSFLPCGPESRRLITTMTYQVSRFLSYLQVSLSIF